MSFETYYPEQRQMLNAAVIRRPRLLPEDTYEAQVEVGVGTRVGLKDVIARGYAPAPYMLIDAGAFFGVRNAAALQPLIAVQPGDFVERTQILAQKGRRRLYSPVTGRVVLIDGTDILLQEESSSVELEAGLNGQVIETRPERGVVIETMGALLQGVWGNGKRAISTLRFAPDAGLEMMQTDELDFDYRGAIIITKQPLTHNSLQTMAEQSFAGVIAPSLENNLIREAQRAPGAILLTEGIGSMRMSLPVVQFLEGVEGRQATLDASWAEGGSARAELIVNVPLANERPTPPLLNLSLQLGMIVRVARADGASVFGKVISVPRNPVMLENGLKLPCAQVETVTGERIFAPLSNIEVPGR